MNDVVVDRCVTADEPLYNITQADFPEIVLLRNWS